MVLQSPVIMVHIETQKGKVLRANQNNAKSLGFKGPRVTASGMKTLLLLGLIYMLDVQSSKQLFFEIGKTIQLWNLPRLRSVRNSTRCKLDAQSSK